MQIFPPKFQDWLRAMIDDVDAYGGMVHVHVQGALELAAALDVPVGVRNHGDLLRDPDSLWAQALRDQTPLRAVSWKDLSPTSEAAEVYVLPVEGPQIPKVRAIVSLNFRPAVDFSDEKLQELVAMCAGLPPV